jgi:3'-phosphoadenosine 5'-phosphosulfate (PAPS) 3'-phosphatase
LITIDIEQREATLKRIIVNAGDTALRFFQTRKAGEYELKGHQDILTEADTVVEALISDAINLAFPQDVILGEETASQPASAESCGWSIPSTAPPTLPAVLPILRVHRLGSPWCYRTGCHL